MSFQSTKFDMSGVMNKLRAIAEQSIEEKEDVPAAAGKEIDSASFTRTMSRLVAIKDAVSEDEFNALRSGVRALYMNRRPNLQQMSALMDLLETVLAYVAEDNSLFQRLKSDLAKSKSASPAEEPAADANPMNQQAPAGQMPGAASEAEPRGLK